MENLNAEQVKKALEWAISEEFCENCLCTVYGKSMTIFLNEVLAIINSQEQRIKELAEKIKDLTETVEVRGKVVERLQILTNEIEEDNRKLTEENENLYRTLDDKIQEQQRLIEARDGFENLARTAIETQNRMSDTIEELTEENERLRVDNKIKSQKRANFFEIVNAFERGRTDGVRKMQERFIAEIEQTPNANEHFINAWKSKIDRIAKEMLDGHQRMD